MKINYRLAVEDFWRYKLYTLERRPTVKLALGPGRYGIGLGLTAALPALANGYGDPYSLLLGFGLGGLWLALSLGLWRWAARRAALGVLKAEDFFSGDYALEITGPALIESAPGRTSRLEWPRIGKVAVNRARLYIYVDGPSSSVLADPLQPLPAVIVPLEAFGDILQYNEFLTRLADGTGLPLDVLKVGESFGPVPAKSSRPRRRARGIRPHRGQAPSADAQKN